MSNINNSKSSDMNYDDINNGNVPITSLSKIALPPTTTTTGMKYNDDCQTSNINPGHSISSILSPTSVKKKSMAALEALNDLSSRRARRYKPIDITKELVILMPNDDPIQRLNVTNKEIDDLKQCLEEVVDY